MDLKQTCTAKQVCKGRAKPFAPILEMLYNFEWDTEPDYSKIIFMFKKIVLDKSIVPLNSNLSYFSDFAGNRASRNRELISNESNQINEDDLEENACLCDLEKIYCFEN